MTAPASQGPERPRARSEAGFTLILVLGVMFVVSVLIAASVVGAVGEINLSRTATSQKKAYYAAQAGIGDYLFHLDEDGDYLTHCTSPTPANAALNNYYKSSSSNVPLRATELTKAKVPESSEEEYAIQLLPSRSAEARGEYQCNQEKVAETMIEESEPVAGTFRIKATGFSGHEKASIVATFKNEGFLAFAWYSVYEATDPAFYRGYKTETELSNCEGYWPERYEKGCTISHQIYKASDSVHGPIHSEDHAEICGSPTLGRTKTDKVEFGHYGVAAEGTEEASLGYSKETQSCTNELTMNGTYVPVANVASIQPPPSDAELASLVETEYEFHDKTQITLAGSTLEITEHPHWNSASLTEREKTERVVKAWPATGVIYVANNSCTEAYQPFIVEYTEPTECGNLWVHGTYSKSLTIAAENDVVVNGNINDSTEVSGKPAGSALFGMIADKFVRVYHPVLSGYVDEPLANNCTRPAVNPMTEITIDASILALNGSFDLDNVLCQREYPENNLNVYGAIAQLYRGPVSVSACGGTTCTFVSGYHKNYNYDERLRAGEPPHFLNPVRAAWQIQRETNATAPS